VDFHAAERVRRGSARPGHEGGSRALRGVVSFGDFSLDKQRKVTCRGSATHKLHLIVATGDSTQFYHLKNKKPRMRGFQFYFAYSTNLTYPSRPYRRWVSLFGG
jgi:hypothetical protein